MKNILLLELLSNFFISKKGITLYESIKLLHNLNKYSLNSICNALNVNKSSYLYWLNFGIKNEEKLIHFYQAILKVYVHSFGIYGSPRITIILNNQGIICSTSKVAKAMRLLGIRSIVSKKFPHRKSSLTDEEKSLIVNLIKNLEITKLNQVWTTDITYINSINKVLFI